jgi:hypothetical protein
MRTEIIKFRVSKEEQVSINSLRLAGEDLSVAARRVLLSCVKVNEDPESRRIGVINSKISEIDKKVSDLSLERDVLVGLIEQPHKRPKK